MTAGTTPTYRAVAQVDYLGNFQVTNTNAYSGNNGRAAILAPNGNYYLVGNAGNGGFNLNSTTTVNNSTSVTTASTYGMVAGQSITGNNIPANDTVASVVDATHFTITTAANKGGADTKAKIVTNGTTLSNLSDNTGVQMITPGSASPNTTVVGAVNGTFGNSTGYQRGFSAAPTDKTGKDDNFRGETIYNNTIYVTKGSGGNGVNSVFQVGSQGSLPTFASAGSTPISVLAGFPTTGTNTHPFGLWFANATTLFVGDEGAGGTTDPNAGLEKWTFDGTKWNLAYTLQLGLIGSTYTVTDPNNSSNSINETAVGLRNITGKLNGDGTATIFGITSTTSSLTDTGADPNQLVSITDQLSATTPGTESFTVLDTAAYGQALRGVSFAPVPELHTWAMVAWGFGILILLQRRRRLFRAAPGR